MLKKLLAISSDAIVARKPDIAHMQNFLRAWKDLGSELVDLLSIRNGFWAYESSFLVRPYTRDVPLGIVEWNDKQLWKGKYAADLDHALFFAEDAFGCQHCIVDSKVSLFDPETAQFEELARSLEDWARIVVDDYEFRTGFPLAHAWQIQNDPLEPGTRLLPKVPFVLGGEFEINNLYVSDDVQGMVFRASIANQIRDLPEGAQVVLEVVNQKKQ